MAVCARIGEGEADRHDVQKRRIRHLRALAPEIVAGVEKEFEPPDAGFGRRDQRRLCSVRPFELVAMAATSFRLPSVSSW